MEESGKEENMEEYMEESKGRLTPSTSAKRVDLEDFTAAVLRGVQRAIEARSYAEGATEALGSTERRIRLDPDELPFPITAGLIMDPRWPPPWWHPEEPPGQ